MAVRNRLLISLAFAAIAGLSPACGEQKQEGHEKKPANTKADRSGETSPAAPVGNTAGTPSSSDANATTSTATGGEAHVGLPEVQPSAPSTPGDNSGIAGILSGLLSGGGVGGASGLAGLLSKMDPAQLKALLGSVPGGADALTSATSGGKIDPEGLKKLLAGLSPDQMKALLAKVPSSGTSGLQGLLSSLLGTGTSAGTGSSSGSGP